MAVQDLRCEIPLTEMIWAGVLVDAGFDLAAPYSYDFDSAREMHIFTQKQEDLVIHALQRMFAPPRLRLRTGTGGDVTITGGRGGARS